MDKMRDLTMQMRQNHQEVGDFLKDLDSWQGDIKKQDESLKNMKPGAKAESAYPPVRSKPILEKVKKKREEDAQKVKKERIKSSDYRKWERLDVDAMLKDVDDEEREMEEEVQLEVDKLDAQRKVKVATEMKEKGNEHFKNSGYEAAIECYTTGMQADPSNPVFPANRAMAFLKLKRFTETEADCTLALSLDPCYTKAYLRRGAARVALGKSSSARKDFMDAMRLEPGNPQAKAEIRKLDEAENAGKKTKKTEKVNDTGNVAKTNSKYVKPVFIPPKLRSKKPMMRVEIQEIGFEEDKTRKTNGTISKAELDLILNRGSEKENIPQEKIEKKETSSPLISVIQEKARSDYQETQDDDAKTEQGGNGKDSTKSLISPVSEVPQSGKSKDPKLKTESEESSKTKPSKTSIGEIDFSKEEKVWARPRYFVNMASAAEDNDNSSGTTDSGSAARTKIPIAPTTSFQFQADVRQLADEPENLLKYVVQISPSHIPMLLKEQLETATLMPIVKCFKLSTSYDTVYEYLTQFSRVRRFEMAVLFLSDNEKKAARSVFSQLEDNLPEKRGSVKILGRKYGL